MIQWMDQQNRRESSRNHSTWTEKKRDREWERKNVFNEDSLREHWDNIKDTDSHRIEVPEGEERRKGAS